MVAVAHSSAAACGSVSLGLHSWSPSLVWHTVGLCGHDVPLLSTPATGDGRSTHAPMVVLPFSRVKDPLRGAGPRALSNPMRHQSASTSVPPPPSSSKGLLIWHSAGPSGHDVPVPSPLLASDGRSVNAPSVVLPFSGANGPMRLTGPCSLGNAMRPRSASTSVCHPQAHQKDHSAVSASVVPDNRPLPPPLRGGLQHWLDMCSLHDLICQDVGLQPSLVSAGTTPHPLPLLLLINPC